MEVFRLPEWMHTALLVAMVYGLVRVRFGGRLETRARLREDAGKLRAALSAELQALRRIYRMNHALLSAQSLQIFPARGFFTVFRGNMNRMLLLTETELEALVTAHAACESLDAAMLIRARGGREAASAMPELLRLHNFARMQVDAALVALEQAARAPAPPRWSLEGLRMRWAALRARLGLGESGRHKAIGAESA